MNPLLGDGVRATQSPITTDDDQSVYAFLVHIADGFPLSVFGAKGFTALSLEPSAAET